MFNANGSRVGYAKSRRNYRQNLLAHEAILEESLCPYDVGVVGLIDKRKVSVIYFWPQVGHALQLWYDKFPEHPTINQAVIGGFHPSGAAKVKR